MSPPAPPLILLVDDDPEALFVIRRLLGKAGVNNPIVTVSNGAEAIEHLRRACLAGGGSRARKPALIFLDVNMPLLDGFAVLRWIRRKPAYRQTKVVMLSSSDDPGDLARAAALRVDGYLYKFPSSAVFAATVHQALGSGALPAASPVAAAARVSPPPVAAAKRG